MNESKMNYSKRLSILFASVAFVVTAALGIIYNSNLWPPAAVLYAFIGAILGALIGGVINFFVNRNTKSPKT